MARYFRRRWDEGPGSELAGWGTSDWLLVTDEHGVVTEQIEIFENGNVLAYDESHVVDEYGGLSDQPLSFSDFASFEITAEEFARATRELAPLNR